MKWPEFLFHSRNEIAFFTVSNCVAVLCGLERNRILTEKESIGYGTPLFHPPLVYRKAERKARK